MLDTLAFIGAALQYAAATLFKFSVEITQQVPSRLLVLES
jgi:hypothetical protein